MSVKVKGKLKLKLKQKTGKKEGKNGREGGYVQNIKRHSSIPKVGGVMGDKQKSRV